MTTIRSKVTGAFDKLAAKQPDAIQTGTIQQPTPTAAGHLIPRAARLEPRLIRYRFAWLCLR